MVWIIFTNKLHDVAKDLQVQIRLSNESVPLKKVIHFAPTFGKLAPQSSTTLLFCPLHPLEKCYFQGTGR